MNSYIAVTGLFDSAGFDGFRLDSAARLVPDPFNFKIGTAPAPGAPGVTGALAALESAVTTLNAVDLGGLHGATTGFRFDGAPSQAVAGASVAGAGDINGDGVDDLIVGAPGLNHGAGGAYVIYGQASPFPDHVNLAQLHGASTGFQLIDTLALADAGVSVSSAGDVNGDGVGDLIVGAPTGSANGHWSGTSYVVFGQAGGFTDALDINSLNGTNGFKLNGPLDSVSGSDVASGGDVNGDGVGDLIVGAKWAGAGGAGASYVLFGHQGAFDANIELAGLDGSDGFQILGAADGDYSGSSVAGAGDVNGDGVDDLIVGAYTAERPGSIRGVTYVVFGRTDGFGGTLNLGDIDGHNGFAINGWGEAGNAVSAAGDINGDGFADLIIGAPFASTHGVNFVVFGSASGFGGSLDLTDLHGSNGFRIDGGVAKNGMGGAVSAAGDVNGDGFDDIIVGSDGFYGSDDASYVIFGKRSGFEASIDLAHLKATDGFELTGPDGSRAGHAVAAAGDVNGDGFDDLIIGAPGLSPGGGGYVVFGQAPDEAVTRTGSDVGQTIHGGDFDDVLSGLGGDDDLIGGDGNDTLVGGLGADTLDGGAGSDTASYASAASAVTVVASQSPHVQAGAEGADVLISIENLIGSNFDDTLTGDSGDNRLEGGAGHDSLTGGKGADTLVGGEGNDRLDGGKGVDTASYAAAASAVNVNLDPGSQDTRGAGLDLLVSIESLIGSAFDDILAGSAWANTVVGGEGDDTLLGGGTLFGGHDLLDGGAGNDTASFTDMSFAVSVNLSQGNARTNSGSARLVGIENVIGTAQNDTITGDSGANLLSGGDGNDFLAGLGGDDTFRGGAGLDWVSFARAGAGVTLSLATSAAQETGVGLVTVTLVESVQGSNFGDVLAGAAAGAFTLDGGGGDDRLIEGGGGGHRILLAGGAGVDTADWSATAGDHWSLSLKSGLASNADGHQARLTGIENLVGSVQADKLTGDAARNLLDANAGDDTVSGGDGADTLVGGAGADQLIGGGGVDVFGFAAGDATADVQDDIADFHHGEDRIDLTGFGLEFTFVSDFNGVANEVRISEVDEGNLVSIDLDGDGASDFNILVHVAHHGLTQGDFVT